jgi:IS30 family transposase
MNGLVRQYIPKNRKLTSVTIDELEQIMIKLNHRPRKCLDFKSPFEVFFGQFVALMI